jgi:hypothetical protein
MTAPHTLLVLAAGCTLALTATAQERLTVRRPQAAHPAPRLVFEGGPAEGLAWLLETDGATRANGLPAGRLLARLRLDHAGGFALDLPPSACERAPRLAVVTLDPRGGWTFASAPASVQLPPAQDAGAPEVGGFQTGEVIVSEYHKDPFAVSDAAGEWLEFFNTTNTPIDVEGWVLSDHGSDSTVLDNGGFGMVVQGRGYLVVGKNLDPNFNGGVVGLYEYQGFTLANGADEIVLARPNGLVVDEVVYGDGPDWPDAPGVSAQLGVLGPDINDDPAWWCDSSTPFGDGDLGTPGTQNVLCGG